ncbi:MAG TPA: DUF4234 domain-containing protein [Acidimicrobiales bacterium]|jgi:hypothetical protein|nr:DUF4234 domain-containing protein [Acidimicrobiales bacterium]
MTQPPPPPPVAPGLGRIGKHRNIILVWLVWPAITLGIYSLVWWYKINRETHDFDRRIEVSPGVAVLAFIPGAVLLVPPFVSTFRTGKRIQQAELAAGVPNPMSPGVGLLLAFIFRLNVIYMQSHLNELWAVYNSPPEGTEVQLAA